MVGVVECPPWGRHLRRVRVVFWDELSAAEDLGDLECGERLDAELALDVVLRVDEHVVDDGDVVVRVVDAVVAGHGDLEDAGETVEPVAGLGLGVEPAHALDCGVEPVSVVVGEDRSDALWEPLAHFEGAVARLVREHVHHARVAPSHDLLKLALQRQLARVDDAPPGAASVDSFFARRHDIHPNTLGYRGKSRDGARGKSNASGLTPRVSVGRLEEAALLVVVALGPKLYSYVFLVPVRQKNSILSFNSTIRKLAEIV